MALSRQVLSCGRWSWWGGGRRSAITAVMYLLIDIVLFYNNHYLLFLTHFSLFDVICVHRRTGKFSKGGQTIQIARMAPQIARIDRLFGERKFFACMQTLGILIEYS